MTTSPLIDITEKLSRKVGRLKFADPVTHVYNPLVYAKESHHDYLNKYGNKKGRVLFLGMNPGPWGMAQTGVPFGEIAAVSDWMKIKGTIRKPKNEHPKRPIEGFSCSRSEVSGRRLWGLAQSHWGTARKFFSQFFVVNYCPLVFMEESGKNRTPDKLPAAERAPLEKACDASFFEMVEALAPKMIVGVGAFAEKCAQRVVGDAVPTGRVLHPSPASPKANRGWEKYALEDLDKLGLV